MTKTAKKSKQQAAESTADAKHGRPTSYKPEYDDLAYKFCLLGATNPELATYFEVATSTIDKWIAEKDSFSGAVKRGREEADANVTNRLYMRAIGYEHESEEIKVINGQVVRVPIRKIYPPDPTAAIFWLKNRQRTKWRDKIDHEHTGKDGGAIQTEEVGVIAQARKIAFALALAQRKATESKSDKSS